MGTWRSEGGGDRRVRHPHANATQARWMRGQSAVTTGTKEHYPARGWRVLWRGHRAGGGDPDSDPAMGFNFADCSQRK